MKKIFATLALAAMATAASAQLTGIVKYDHDRADGVSVNRATTSLKYGFGTLGAVDAGYVYGRISNGAAHLSGNGFDIGYSNGLKLGAVGVTGRLGYSELRATGGQLNRLSASVEGSLPVTATVTAVAGYEYSDLRLKLGGATTEGHAHRYTVGADFALTKNVTLRAAYARTRAEGSDANGLTAAVSYKF